MARPWKCTLTLLIWVALACWDSEKTRALSGNESLGVGNEQVGASVGVEKHAVPLNLLLEPVKQNSFILCVGVMVDWEDSLNSNDSLQA